MLSFINLGLGANSHPQLRFSYRDGCITFYLLREIASVSGLPEVVFFVCL